MVFHDFAHNGQSQTGALGAGGDVRLGQPVTMFRRQTHAIVGDTKGKICTVRFQRDGDLARFVVAPGDAGRDAFAGVLEDIGKRLGHQSSVAFEPDGRHGHIG